MRLPIHAKTLTIAVLALALFVPVTMISDLVAERKARHAAAIQDIALGWGQPQTLTDPYVVIPYQRVWTEVARETVDGVHRERRRERSESLRLRVPLERIRWSVDLATQEKSRGIYTARLYTAKVIAHGSLTLPARMAEDAGGARYVWGKPQLVVGVSDSRGLRRVAALRIGDREVEFAPGAGDEALPTGIHTTGDLAPAAQSGSLTFEISLEVSGSETFAIAPLTQDTQVIVRSGWQHPSFRGAFLPARSAVTAQGFAAEWQMSRYATQGGERLAACAKGPCPALSAKALEISLIEPLGIYRQLERASKYGFLFIGLSFAAVLLLELLRRLAIHPIQYTLIGLALAIFFLLLTALSEHLSFGFAYALATLGCVGLVTAYVVRALHSVPLGLAFGGALAALYAVLYLLLRAEDHALLGGAVLLFLLLAASMLATRNTDWYELTQIGSARE